MAVQLIFDGTEHYTGSVLRGKVVDSSYKSSDITVTITGEAQTSWSQVVSGRHRQTLYNYRNRILYVDAKTQLQCTSAQSGRRFYPFEYQIPLNAPPPFEGFYGHVKYLVKVFATTPDKVANSFPVCTEKIIIKDGRNLLAAQGEPKSFEVGKKVGLLCCGSGKIVGSCTIPRTGFSPGENVPFKVQIENNTARHIHIRAASVEDIVYVGPSNLGRKFTQKKISRTVSPQIVPGQSTVFDSSALMIPSEAPTTLRNCQCISIEYTLVVKVAIPWGFNKTIRIPILVANKPPPPQSTARLQVTPQQAAILLQILKDKALETMKNTSTTDTAKVK